MNPGINHNLPVHQFMERYLSRDRIPFHTPGHKGTLLNECNLGDMPVADIPDDLCGFPGVLEKSQQMAANLLWTSATYFLTNGSTAGVQAMFLTILQPGMKVIVGRNLHMSAVSAMIMTGAVPVYVPVEYDSQGIPLNITPGRIREVARQHPDAVAVFVTSPSYLGVCADLEEICQVTRQYRMHLLSDEAWGAHFPFGNDLPISALKAGASMAVHGSHKTLPVLTGGAMLHVMNDDIPKDRVEECLSMVQTSSPNLLFYLSLERAVSMMKVQGPALLHTARRNRDQAVAKIQEIMPGFLADFDTIPGFDMDPLKLLLRTCPQQTGITGTQLAEMLIRRGSIIPEMADQDAVLFIFTGFESPGDGTALVEELATVYQALSSRGDPSHFKDQPLIMADIPRQAMSPREAFFSRGWKVPLESSEGRVCRTGLVPYPPGIPVFLPGEIITGDGVAHIMSVIDHGGVVRGLSGDDGGCYVDVI